MTADFYRWEVDPFFTAAEDVQDSADRMESAFRTWLNDQSLVEANPTEMDLAKSIEIGRRELLIAIGTAKWQLEDFERAIKDTAPNVKMCSREDSLSRHMRFIVAIQNQIAGIEKALQDSATNFGNGSMQWVDLDDQERDDFATFLSGGGPCKSSLEHSICRNSCEQQIKVKFATHTDLQELKEMVELRLDNTPLLNGETRRSKLRLDNTPLLHGETRWSKLQGARHSDIDGACAVDNHVYGISETGLMGKDSDFGVELSHRVSEARDDWHTGCPTERSTGHKRSASAGVELGAYKIAIADNDIGERTYDSTSENFACEFNFWGLLNSLKLPFKFKVSGSVMKRLKDGEGSTNHSKDEKIYANGGIHYLVLVEKNVDFELYNQQDGSTSTTAFVKRVLNTLLGGNDTVFNGGHVPYYSISDDKLLHGWTGNVQRRFQRSQYFIQYSRLHSVRLGSAILVTLGLVGIFTFHVT